MGTPNTEMSYSPISLQGGGCIGDYIGSIITGLIKGDSMGLDYSSYPL